MTATKEEKKAMGRTVVEITIKNSGDLLLARKGHIAPDKVRSLKIQALVDTGAARLCLSKELIEQLGLSFVEESRVDTAKGITKVKRYTDAWVTIMDRSCPADVLEIESKTSAVVGYLILEALDLVVDPTKQIVTGNPAHDGQMIIDLL